MYAPIREIFGGLFGVHNMGQMLHCTVPHGSFSSSTHNGWDIEAVTYP